MSHLTETIKKQLDERRATAAAGWQAFTDYREKNGDENIAKSTEMFDEAHRLHAVYGEAADEAASLEAKLFQSLEMDGDAPSSLDTKNGKEVADFKAQEGFKALRGALGSKAAHALVESDSYKAFLADATKQSTTVSSGGLFNIKDALSEAEVKTLLTGLSSTEGGAFVVNERLNLLVESFDRVNNVFASLVTVGSTSSDTVEWVSFDTRTNNAAETLEAVDADKTAGAAASSAPESALAFSVKSAIVEEIKHFIPATKRSTADAGQLRTIIDQELLLGLQDRLDTQILGGNGTTPNLKGILNTAGIQTQAKGADTNVDAIHKAFTKLIISNYSNLTMVLNANDWQLIRLAKDANGNYFYGPPSVAGPKQLWGYPVLTSQRLSAGTGVAADYARACTLWLKEGASIAATDSHSDWFTKGIVAILASMRCSFAVTRPKGVCTVTGIV